MTVPFLNSIGRRLLGMVGIFLWSSFALVFGLCLVVALTISKSITKPLDEAVTFAHAVADGDLSSRLQAPDAREIANLTEAMNGICDRVGHIVRSVLDSTTAVATSSEELSVVSQQIASNAEETAAQVATL
jgi:methyl-accepting chemotaxis protein